MRPTPEGVGNWPDCWIGCCGSCRFNEAHARRRGKYRREREAVEARMASMRPTPEGVGNKDATQDAAIAALASMRPTPEGVGNSATVPSVATNTTLQ